MSDDRQQWAVRYRPSSTDDGFIVNDQLLKRINTLIKNKSAHAILITGPSGSGKTTLARIIARALNNATEGERIPDTQEINAFDKGRIEDVRNMIRLSGLLPQGKNRSIFILDEAHGFTGQSEQLMLKEVEEPRHNRLVWILCTNEPWRLRQTMINRCIPLVVPSPTTEQLVSIFRSVMRKAVRDYPDCSLASMSKEDRAGLAKMVTANCGGVPRFGIQLLQSAVESGLSLKEIKSEGLLSSNDITSDTAVAKILFLWNAGKAAKLGVFIKTLTATDTYLLFNRLRQAVNALLIEQSGGARNSTIYPIVKMLNENDAKLTIPKLVTLASVCSDIARTVSSFSESPALTIIPVLAKAFMDNATATNAQD